MLKADWEAKHEACAHILHKIVTFNVWLSGLRPILSVHYGTVHTKIVCDQSTSPVRQFLCRQ